MRERKRIVVAALAMACVAGSGCGGDARVELATADAMQSLATAMDQVLGEYHEGIVGADDGREGAAITALVTRVTRDAGDENKVSGHAEAFSQALAKLRGDRAVEWQRYRAALDNVALLRETAADLRRLAVASMSLQDETRRYVLALFDRG